MQDSVQEAGVSEGRLMPPCGGGIVEDHLGAPGTIGRWLHVPKWEEG